MLYICPPFLLIKHFCESEYNNNKRKEEIYFAFSPSDKGGKKWEVVDRDERDIERVIKSGVRKVRMLPDEKREQLETERDRDEKSDTRPIVMRKHTHTYGSTSPHGKLKQKKEKVVIIMEFFLEMCV